jgi:hypothetical protein
MVGSESSNWFEDLEPDDSEPGSTKRHDEIASVIHILDSVEMVSLKPAEIKDIGSLYLPEGDITRILWQLEEVGVAEEENGHWSLSSDDAVLAEMNGSMLGKIAVGEANWAEYDDPNLENLPGIGES